MAGIFSFKCSCCGKQHEGSPSFGLKVPDPWLGQPEEIKQEGKIEDDLCYYTDEDSTNRISDEDGCFIGHIADSLATLKFAILSITLAWFIFTALAFGRKKQS